MSYSLRILREDGAARLDIGDGMAQYLPDEIIISGHHVQPGTHSHESVTVTVRDGEADSYGGRPQLLQVSASNPRPDAAEAPKAVPIDETPIAAAADEDVPTFPGN